MSKLVRDKIPQIIPADKKTLYSFSTLDDKEYRKQLNKKLLEEVNEYIQDENVEELADVYEVLDAILVLNNINKIDLHHVKDKKKEERGAFENRIFMTVLSSNI